jgi:phasin family protein
MDQARQAGEEFTKMFSAMKFPAAPNIEALLAVQKRNMDALSAANRIALEGAQTVAKRHMEIMQQTMTELGDTMRALSATEAPQEKAATQTELMKRAYERAVANTKEMTDLIQRANGEAVEQLNHRFVEAMEEMKALMDKAGIKP